MSEFREPKIKVCKVDIKIMLENFCGGPPNLGPVIGECLAKIELDHMVQSN